MNQVNHLRDEGLEDAGILDLLHTVSRDNARIPMHWNNDKNYGFSNTIPWLQHGSCEQSVENDKYSNDSIYKKYTDMISWTKENYHDLEGEMIVSANDDYMIIKRNEFTMYVNLSDKILDNVCSTEQLLIMSNYTEEDKTLRPYEFKLLKIFK